MLQDHLYRHGQSYRQHLSNNLRFTWLAIKAALYTLGHGLHPSVSGMRASQLHSELWDEGRKLSMEDIRHRLNNGLYSSRDEALEEFEEYASLYDERPVFSSLKKEIEALQFDKRQA